MKMNFLFNKKVSVLYCLVALLSSQGTLGIEEIKTQADQAPTKSSLATSSAPQKSWLDYSWSDWKRVSRNGRRLPFIDMIGKAHKEALEKRHTELQSQKEALLREKEAELRASTKIALQLIYQSVGKTLTGNSKSKRKQFREQYRPALLKGYAEKNDAFMRNYEEHFATIIEASMQSGREELEQNFIAAMESHFAKCEEDSMSRYKRILGGEDVGEVAPAASAEAWSWKHLWGVYQIPLGFAATLVEPYTEGPKAALHKLQNVSLADAWLAAKQHPLEAFAYGGLTVLATAQLASYAADMALPLGVHFMELLPSAVSSAVDVSSHLINEIMVRPSLFVTSAVSATAFGVLNGKMLTSLSKGINLNPFEKMNFKVFKDKLYRFSKERSRISFTDLAGTSEVKNIVQLLERVVKAGFVAGGTYFALQLPVAAAAALIPTLGIEFQLSAAATSLNPPINLIPVSQTRFCSIASYGASGSEQIWVECANVDGTNIQRMQVSSGAAPHTGPRAALYTADTILPAWSNANAVLSRPVYFGNMTLGSQMTVLPDPGSGITQQGPDIAAYNGAAFVCASTTSISGDKIVKATVSGSGYTVGNKGDFVSLTSDTLAGGAPSMTQSGQKVVLPFLRLSGGQTTIQARSADMPTGTPTNPAFDIRPASTNGASTPLSISLPSDIYAIWGSANIPQGRTVNPSGTLGALYQIQNATVQQGAKIALFPGTNNLAFLLIRIQGLNQYLVMQVTDWTTGQDLTGLFGIPTNPSAGAGLGDVATLSGNTAVSCWTSSGVAKCRGITFASSTTSPPPTTSSSGTPAPTTSGTPGPTSGTTAPTSSRTPAPTSGTTVPTSSGTPAPTSSSAGSFLSPSSLLTTFVIGGTVLDSLTEGFFSDVITQGIEIFGFERAKPETIKAS